MKILLLILAGVFTASNARSMAEGPIETASTASELESLKSQAEKFFQTQKENYEAVIASVEEDNKLASQKVYDADLAMANADKEYQEKAADRAFAEATLHEADNAVHGAQISLEYFNSIYETVAAESASAIELANEDLVAAKAKYSNQMSLITLIKDRVESLKAENQNSKTA
jgi:hypothetical protein